MKFLFSINKKKLMNHLKINYFTDSKIRNWFALDFY